MIALEAVGHAGEVDPAAGRAHLAAESKDAEALAAARTLLGLARDGVLALRAALLLGTKVLVIGATYVRVCVCMHAEQREGTNRQTCRPAKGVEPIV